MDSLRKIRQDILSCTKCRLADPGHQVPGEGPEDPLFVIVGEAPGATERELGRPFVGEAGMLLEKALKAAGLRRERIYITNTVHCRPPGNRTPTPSEVNACICYALREIEVLKPRIVLCLGAVAAKALIKPDFRITKERGIFFESVCPGSELIAAQFHPAYLLRLSGEKQVEAKWEVFNTLLKIKELLDQNAGAVS